MQVHAKEKINVNLNDNQNVYIFKESTYDDSLKDEDKYIEYYIYATNSKGDGIKYLKCSSSNKKVADVRDDKIIRFYKPGKTIITIKSGKNKIKRTVNVKKALGWKDVFSVGKKYSYSKDGIVKIKITNKMPFIVTGKIKYNVYDIDGNLKYKNHSSEVFVGPKEKLIHQLVNVYAKRGDYIEIKGVYNLECKQFAYNNTKYPTIEKSICKIPNFPYLEYYCEVFNPYNYGIYVPYNVYFYSDSGKLFHIEHHYQYINPGETKKLKSDDRTLYDETQKFEIGKVVVYQSEKTKVTDKKRDALPIKGINVVSNSGFEKFDYSMWNVKHSSITELSLDTDGSLPVGIESKSADAHTKERSVHFWTPYNDQFSVEQVVKKSKLTKGTYQASVYIQGDEVGSNAEIYLYVISNGKKYTSKYAKLNGYNKWKKLEIKNIKHKSGDMIIGVKVKHAANGWGFIDDFNLKYIK